MKVSFRVILLMALALAIILKHFNIIIHLVAYSYFNQN